MQGSPLRHAALGKLERPRLGRVFDRRRLFKQLDGFTGSPGLWLAAPPGAGKTTLLATWLRQREEPTLWLRVDTDDADPATFVQSLDALFGTLLSAPLELPLFRADDLSDLPGWLRRRLRHLLPRMPSRWTLVLDNQQELPADSGMQVALAEMLAELPAGVQWIFVSREPPPPAYTLTLARQQLALPDGQQLRFDEAETRELIRLHGHADGMVEPLAAAQGWAAGLTLMLLGRPTGDHLPALAARERLFEYFADEVLSRMPTAHQHTLCVLAFLPSTTGELAVAMSGDAEAPALLERLATASLFTDRRGDSPKIFTFHALFSEFLRRRFERLATADELQALLCRAGHLLLAAGEVDSGLQRLIEGQAWNEAASWILRCAPRYVDEGRVLSLRRYIDALPANLGADLAYWRGFCMLDLDPPAALADMTAAFQHCLEAGDVQGQLEAAAAACTVLVTTWCLPELDPWIAVLTQHSAVAMGVGDPNAEMRLVPGLLAALIHRMPWHPATAPLAERAERLMHRESAVGQRLLLGSLAFHFLWSGQLERLERLILRIDGLCRQGLAAPVTLMRWWGVGILVKSLLGQVESAGADVRQALMMAEVEPSLAPHRNHIELQAVMVGIATRDAAAIRLHLGRVAPALHPDHAANRSLYELERGLLALIDGEAPMALRLLRAATQSSRQGAFAVQEHISLISHALAAAACDEHDEAQQALAAALSHPLYPVCRWHHWISSGVAAYASLRRGDEVQACLELGQAFAVAREHGYRHGPLLFLCSDAMPRLCALALAHGIETDTVRYFIARHRIKAPAEAGDSWPWAVHVHMLGRFEVRIDGAPLAPSRKESRRLLELLRLLVAHGATPLMQDAVADQLWPDADGDAARNALDNALHRLRKLLGSEDCILVRHGALVLNRERCWTDVQALERLLGEIESAELSRLPTLLLSLRQRYPAPLQLDAGSSAINERRAALQRQVKLVAQRALQRLASSGAADDSTATWVAETLHNL